MDAKLECISTEELTKLFDDGTRNMDLMALVSLRNLQVPKGWGKDHPKIQYLLSLRKEILRRKKQEAAGRKRITHG